MKSNHSIFVFLLSVMLSSTTVLAASKVCKGNTVYGKRDNVHYVGTVKNVYGQTVEVLSKYIDGAPTDLNKLDYWDLQDLSAEVNCYNKICQGKTVYGHNKEHHLVGSVNHVFENGTVEVIWTYMDGERIQQIISYWPTDQLSPQTDCYFDVCTGASVYGFNDNHLTGTVTKIFNNKIAEVQWITKNGTPWSVTLAYWPVSTLKKLSAPCRTDNCT